MQKFRQHLTQLLVATDVAARGLDVDDLTHVINYGLPDDIESYTHRSGRTGRAGKKGTSISIVHSREKSKIRAIEKTIGKNFVEGEIPSAEEICKKQLYKVMDQIVKTDVNEEEIAPFMDDINRYFEFIDKEDVIKKIVSLEFGKFLAYYADAPEIGKPSGRGDKKEKKRTSDERKRTHKAEPGYRRLFINTGQGRRLLPRRADAVRQPQHARRTAGNRRHRPHVEDVVLRSARERRGERNACIGRHHVQGTAGALQRRRPRQQAAARRTQGRQAGRLRQEAAPRPEGRRRAC